MISRKFMKSSRQQGWFALMISPRAASLTRRFERRWFSIGFSHGIQGQVGEVLLTAEMAEESEIAGRLGLI